MADELRCEYEKVPTIEFSDNDLKTEEKPSYGYGVRHVQCFIIFLSLLIGFISRAHLGVSIVAMTYNPSITHHPIDIAMNITNHVDIRLNKSIHNKESTEETKMNAITVIENETKINVKLLLQHEEWNKNTIERESTTSDENSIFKIQVVQANSRDGSDLVFPGILRDAVRHEFGRPAVRGGMVPLQIGLLVTGFVSIATPWLAFWGGWKAVCVCRILQGASQGGFYPSIQTLLAQWVPPNERAMLASCIYTASIIGTIISFQLGGVLAASPWGWPSNFWGTGILCFLAYVILVIFGAATPAENKSITEEEVKYITYTMTNVDKKKPGMPLKAVLSSKHVWAAFATHAGSTTAFLFTFMQVPSYIHYSLGVNVKNSGLFSSLPYVVSFFTSLFYGVFSDYLTNRNMVRVKTARRLFNSVSQVGMATCLLAVPFTKNISLAITLLVIGQSLNAAVHVGWMLNYIDLSSNFSGALLALGNTLSNIFTLALPILVSFIVTDVTNQTQWRVMFILTAAFALVTNAIFVIFMSAERQPWDDVKHKRPDYDRVEEKLKKATQ